MIQQGAAIDASAVELRGLDVETLGVAELTASLKGVDGLVIAVGFVPGNPFKMTAAAQAVDNVGTVKLIDAAKVNPNPNPNPNPNLSSSPGPGPGPDPGPDPSPSPSPYSNSEPYANPNLRQGGGCEEGGPGLVDSHRRRNVGSAGLGRVQDHQRLRPGARGEARGREVPARLRPRLDHRAAGRPQGRRSDWRTLRVRREHA